MDEFFVCKSRPILMALGYLLFAETSNTFLSFYSGRAYLSGAMINFGFTLILPVTSSLDLAAIFNPEVAPAFC